MDANKGVSATNRRQPRSKPRLEVDQTALLVPLEDTYLTVLGNPTVQGARAGVGTTLTEPEDQDTAGFRSWVSSQVGIRHTSFEGLSLLQGQATPGLGSNLNFLQLNLAGQAARLATIADRSVTTTPGAACGGLLLHTRPAGSDVVERLWIDPAGNVGIGTHAPETLLHLGGGALKIGARVIADGGGAYHAP